MAETRIVRCPESGDLVELTLGRTPSGTVVEGCSRFHPPGSLDCTRTCAAQLDRHDRAFIDTRERVLIVVRNLDDEVAIVARAIANALREDRLAVEIADLSVAVPPPLADYDAVVIGARMRFGRYPRVILDYIRDHRGELDDMPASFFTVGPRGTFAIDGSIERMTHRTGWRPITAATFTDASERQRPDVAAFACEIADAVPITDFPTTL